MDEQTISILLYTLIAVSAIVILVTIWYFIRMRNIKKTYGVNDYIDRNSKNKNEPKEPSFSKKK